MLQTLIDWFLYSLIGLNPALVWTNSLNFFIYDSIKIIFLLFVMVAIFGFLRTYISQEKIKKWLSKKNMVAGHFAASLLGAITPFCSCSSIPIFVSFLEAGVPLGITFSFLITSPIINEYLVVLMFGFFGWKITALYVISGILLGTLLGFLFGKMNLEKYLAHNMFTKTKAVKKALKHNSIMSRILFGLGESLRMIKELWIWILIGVGLGAFIHNFVPTDFIQNLVNSTGILTVPLVTLIGVPLYGSCAAIIPIAVALFEKGVPLGTALAFMMSVSALSLPQAIILRRVMNLKLLAIFFGTVTLGIIIIGYLFNFLQFLI